MRLQKINRAKGGRHVRPAPPRSPWVGPRAPHAVRRMWIIGLAMSIGVIHVHLALAVVADAASEYVERGYAHLAQARVEAESATHERLLTMAIAAFKEAYQTEPPEPPIQ